ncbi:hypothetical protein JCM10207_000927 [Rhodosporidiobolus poonsookiae]
MSQYVQTDTTSVVLATAIVAALGVRLYLRPPPPQVHPFLLGRQSTPAPTRNEGESTVFTNSANGGVRAPFRPDRAIRTLPHILGTSSTCLEGKDRGTWVKGGEKLVDVVTALRAGFIAKFAGVEGKVLVSIDDPTDALLVTLALATSPLKPVVIAPGSAVPAELDLVGAVQTATGSLTTAGLNLDPSKVVLVGEEHKDEAFEILATGRTQTAEAISAEPADFALTIISEGIQLEYTHQNLTSALVSWLSLFPASPQPTLPTLKDNLVSFHHPSTPYGFGLALLAIYQNASLTLFSLPTEPSADPEAVLELFNNKSAPPANLVFAPTKVLAQPLYTLILQQMLGDSSFIVRHARNGKLRLLRSGSVSKQTMWDSLLFKGLRKDTGLTHIRGLFLSGPIEYSRLETFRVALGCPCVSTYEHALLLAQLANGNMWDVQRLPPPGAQFVTGREKAPVGAPTVGVELKLKGEEKDFEDGRPRGEILIRSPLLPLPDTLPSALLVQDSTLQPHPPYPNQPASQSAPSKWLRTGVRAEMGTEGTLWVEEEGEK